MLPGLMADIAWAPGDRRLRALLLPAGLVVTSGGATTPDIQVHLTVTLLQFISLHSAAAQRTAILKAKSEVA